MSTFKKLAGDTALYGVSTILGRMLNFALVPLQTYVFKQPSEMASNVELYSWVGILLVIYTLGLETAFFRFTARSGGASNPEDRIRVFNETLSIVIAVSVTFTTAIILLTPQIVVWLGYPGQELSVIWVALIVAIDAIMAIPFARLRVENRARRFVQAKIINILIVVFLNVFFLIICRDIYAEKYLSFLKPAIDLIYYPSIGPGYILLANLVGNATYFVLLRDAFSGFRFQLNKEQTKVLLAYAAPLMLTSLAGLINSMTDRLFLQHWLPEGFYRGLTSKDALGIYGNCLKLSVFMALVIQSFKFAADPFFFSRAEDKNSPKLLADVTKWFIIVCVLIWVGVSLNLDIVGLLVSKKYRSGLSIVPLLLLANLFLGVYYNIAFWFKLSDKTQFGTLITIVGALITVAGNIILIPIIGYMGCAVAFLVSSFAMMVICYGLGEKYYPVPYHVKSAVGYILGAGLLIYGSQQVEIANLWLSVPYHMALFGLFFAVVLVVERSTFVPALQRLRKPKGAVPTPVGPTDEPISKK
ncbi:polysaccharide biosynthesis C-terminal domain-containing protein [Spirosoma agri]|uniref:Polysaccharide biosynthesis protein n=1 Tax=Spirosoma agri TaxID=1987381 RepID=A0A6M0IRA8_9BACT|nr:oligosaccharide flippase family protein [Spirosoma agri]NEU70512.1 polysaccharide biosynthesis protein [Spirosoma agri]